MPSLERFFDPQMRKFDANVRPLPGARLYFFESGTTTPKSTYKDKQGELAHTNPVIADSTGVFPQIFLDGLYRVELRSSANIVQPGWPIDNIGQDSPIVPFGPWSEIVTYTEGEVVTAPNGNWYRSIGNDNLGNEPSVSPSEWEVIPIPVASSFTSNVDWITFSDDGDQISLDLDSAGLIEFISDNLDEINGNQPEITLTIINDYIANVGFPLKAIVLGGVLYINGQVTSPASIVNTTIANLPLLYRPSSERLGLIAADDVGPPFAPDVDRVTIEAGGNIVWGNATPNKLLVFSISVPL